MKHRGKTNTYLVEFLEGDNKENMREENLQIGLIHEQRFKNPE